MAVSYTDGRHSCKEVQVALAVHVPQPLHVALVDEHRALVGGHLHGHGVTVELADLYHALLGHALQRERERERERPGESFLFCFIDMQ